MADIDPLMTEFFVNVGDVVGAGGDPDAADVAITSASRPQTDSGAITTHLIDGKYYFGALRKEIAKLLAGGNDRFFYANSWHFGLSALPDIVPIGEGTFTSAWQKDAREPFKNTPLLPLPFELNDGSGGPFHPMKDDIVQMVAAGVDVRILVWGSPFLVNNEEAATTTGASQFWAINIHSLRSVLDLRQLPGMDERVVINTIGHSLGAAHLKMVVCGDSTGFRGYTSGMDFVSNRISNPVHATWSDGHDFWHDVAIRVEGSTTGDFYHYFEQQWNEQVRRPAATFKAFGAEIKSHVDDTPLLDARDPVPVAGGQQYTQVLRTEPTMNFSFFGTDRVPKSCIKRLISGFKQQKISFSPDGTFQFRAAQRKAVKAAQRYIYIEDQAFENLELAGWINQRLQEVSELRVILLYMGDPADLDAAGMNGILPDFMDLLTHGFPAAGERIAFAMAPYTIHSKLTIIDDVWAAIGSANCMRRSFYMDLEISVAVLDDPVPPVPHFAAELRKDLWGEHCGAAPGPDCDPMLALDNAMAIWHPSWGTPPILQGHPAKLRQGILLKRVPFIFNLFPVQPDTFPGDRPGVTPQQRDILDGDSRLEY